MNKKTVLLGMSGGVDSSVAALLLKKEGYNVIGAFMKNFSDTKNPLTEECLWVEEKKMAQKIASILKIPIITLDYEKLYKKKIIAPMIKKYSKDETPNPDISCNKLIKFPALKKKARELKVEYIATGHYAKITKTKKGYKLMSSRDKTKDQSYFLYELTQNDLKHIIFPLENYTKKEVRKIAKRHKFPNWNKPGTKGICFVGKINMKDFLKKKIQKKPGKIISPDKKVIGSHPGTMYFTIGERVGLRQEIKINDSFRNKIKKRLYVADKMKNNILIVAPKQHPLLKRKKIIIKKIHLINKKQKIPKKGVKARIRNLGSFLSGRLKKHGEKYVFILEKPEEGIAPGQSLVLYNKEELIGGGIISKAL